MNWYRLAQGAPLSNNSPILDDSPDVYDEAKNDKPDLGVVPSLWARPGKNKPKKTKIKKRNPQNDLEEGVKRPTDGTGWPRPDGTGR